NFLCSKARNIVWHTEVVGKSFYKGFIAIGRFSPQAKVAVRDGRTKASLVKQVSHNSGVEPPAYGKKNPVFLLEELVFAYVFQESLQHSQMYQNTDVCGPKFATISIFRTNAVACTMMKASHQLPVVSIQDAIRILALTVLCLVAALTTFAQKNVKLEHADQLSFERDKGYQKLTGNVVFTQNQTTIYCASAYLYKEQSSVEAFGRVRITEGDSVVVTSRRLEYDGNTKKARLRD